MANDAKKVSELVVTTTLSANDRVVVLSNPSSAANTKTITVTNFANTLNTQNIRNAGVVNSLVIDFSTDRIVLVQPNNSSTFTTSNYSAGRKVEVWVNPTTTNSITLSGITNTQITGACTTPVPISGQLIKMTFLSTTTANTGVYVDVNR
jgi:hypothetical protein